MSKRIDQGTSEAVPSTNLSLREQRNKIGRLIGAGILVGAVALGIAVDKLISSSPASIPVLSATDGTLLTGSGNANIVVTIPPNQSAPVLLQARGKARLIADTAFSSPDLQTSVEVSNNGSGKAWSDIQSFEAINTGDPHSYNMHGDIDTDGKDTPWVIQVPHGDQARIIEKS